MSREADRKGTESKRWSPGEEISAPDQLSPGREWKGLRLVALALSRLRSPRQDAAPPSGVFSGVAPPLCEEEEVYHQGWWRRWPCCGAALCTARYQLLTSHSPGALLLPPLPLLRLRVQRFGCFLWWVGMCVARPSGRQANQKGALQPGPLVKRSWG